MKDLKQPIVLVGMMGSGKSTVGRQLARELGLQFYDSDRIIEAAEGLSVVEIYDFRGAEYFQQRETEHVKELLNRGAVVIATGGETFINPDLRDVIKKQAISVWISASPDILYGRICRRNTRPAFNCEDKMGTMMRMLEAYNPIYNEADIKFENHSLDTHLIVDALTVRIKRYIKMHK